MNLILSGTVCGRFVSSDLHHIASTLRSTEVNFCPFVVILLRKAAERQCGILMIIMIMKNLNKQKFLFL